MSAIPDPRLQSRMVREAVGESIAKRAAIKRLGTVSDPAPVGGVAQVVLDEDTVQEAPQPCFPINGASRAVQMGDRVLVELVPPHGAWITQAVTRLATLPAYDETIDQSPVSTGAVVDLPNLVVTFEQFTAGYPVRGFVKTHHVATVVGDHMLVTVRDFGGSGIVQARADFTQNLANIAENASYTFIERPNVGIHLRIVSLQRIGGAGNCFLFSDADRPSLLRYETADPEFPA